MEKEIDVPEHVIRDIETIRRSGKYNMIDGASVWLEMNNNPSMAKSLLWLAEQRGDYYYVDYKKYVAALGELSDLKKMMNDLANS
ncbi:gp606 [Bacillus phage G]|uniref:Gp606 n=1 Tax=Bacillus phage G TaxID=2884420 RepID=G3MAY6_9CAUD|nr:gp606 [Bacillus phage G]AEO93851.1 gp606 [Bacillus phage G]